MSASGIIVLLNSEFFCNVFRQKVGFAAKTSNSAALDMASNFLLKQKAVLFAGKQAI